MKSNITLIGMRGSGKSTIGKMLAQKLDKAFIDTDDKIEKDEEKSIIEIVREDGWMHFRNLEKQCIEEVSANQNAIISTGGGVVEKIENITNLTRSSIIVLIKTPTSVLYERIKNLKNRPPLTKFESRKEISEIWLNRKPKYECSAHITYNKKDVSITEEDADNIIKLIEEYDMSQHS